MRTVATTDVCNGGTLFCPLGSILLTCLQVEGNDRDRKACSIGDGAKVLCYFCNMTRVGHWSA